VISRVFALVLFFVSGLAWAERETVTLQLKWRHQFQFAGYYAAIERGYYREAGIEVVLREAQPGEDPVEAVLRGEAHYGVGTSELILLRADGQPVVLLANIYQHSPLVLLARADGPANDLQALHDQPLMIEPQSAELFAYFRNEGIDPDSLHIVHHTFSVEDLIHGRVAAMSAYSTDEPFSLREAGVPYLQFTPRAGGIDFYGDNLFTTEAELRAHPARVRAFRAASLRGWEYALAHPEEVIDLILSHYGDRKSREHLRFEAEQTIRLMHPALIEVGHMNRGRWRHMAEVYAEFGMIPRGFDVAAMLYDPDPRPDLRPLYWALGLSATLAVALLGWLLPLVRLNRRIRARERQYRELIENAPLPVVISDFSTGTIRFLNRRAAELIGAPPAAVIGRPATEFYVDPAVRKDWLQRLAAGERVDGFEIAYRRADGSVLWTLLSAGEIEFEGRRSVVLAFNDITARRAMEAELRTARERAESDNAARNRYLGVLSHEIRTPMNGILGLLHLLLDPQADELTPDQRESLTLMSTAAESLLGLVNELLQWSQLEADAVRLNPQPLAPGELLDSLVGLFRPAAEAKHLELSLTIAPEVPPVVVTDVHRLRQILSNLLANAVKFTAQGAVRVRLESAPPQDDPTRVGLRFSVADSGPGIPRDKQAEIFAPYTQADASVAQRYGGAGLGLSISTGLARLLGGEITLESEPGRGATFHLTIVTERPAADI
jgi:PAS domain S-box-containing protein